ncbi:MAG TPA: hypothetical protein VFZ65_07015 [Planctomycetota bacterium]|nr:hypothetical protein [Planctomycetota bacterium]
MRIWSASNGQRLATLRGHEALIYSAHYSGDGSRIVTAGWDGIAIVWDAASAEPLTAQAAHERPVLCAEFSPDGASVVSTGIDGCVRRWPADPLGFARRLAAGDGLAPAPAPDWLRR